MKKVLENNKGFSLVELLAVVVILGILMGVAIFGYTRYIDKAKKDAINIFNKSAVSATEEYLMDNPGEETVLVKTLIDDDYLEAPGEKVTDGKSYTGKIEIDAEGNITLYMCFESDKYKYESSTKNKSPLTESEQGKCN